MLNYNSKCTNIIAFIVTLILSVIFLIIIDILIFKDNIDKNNKLTTGVTNIEEFNNAKRKSINDEVINLKDVFLASMQISDIYENSQDNLNIDIENINKIYGYNEVEMPKIINSEWKLEIPTLNLIAPIKKGTTQEVLKTGIGHFEGTPVWNGNVSLAAHNRGYKCNFFAKLKELKIGDKIIYYTKYGKREYKVILNKVINQTDWSYVENTEDNRLTLITCVENMFEYRRCVQAVRIL